MPKFELNQYGEDQELILKPTNGDLRMVSMTLERLENGCWNYIGDLTQLFSDSMILKGDVQLIKNWMLDEQEKAKAQIIADDYEDKDDALREAGEYLRQLEAMLRVARKTYDSMVDETIEKHKTFQRLDSPYPDEENEPGYQI